MDKTTVVFAVLALAAVFALAAPMNVAVAQTTGAVPDGDGEYEGKSCPSKEGKMQNKEYLT